LEEMVRSLHEVGLPYSYGASVVVDDSGDAEYGEWVVEKFPQADAVIAHGNRRGMAASIQSAWEGAIRLAANYVFHVEEAFVFREPFELEKLVQVLNRRAYLSQLVLKRQPWSAEEIRAGGQIEATELAGSPVEQKSTSLGTWCEHRHLFSLNPTL